MSNIKDAISKAYVDSHTPAEILAEDIRATMDGLERGDACYLLGDEVVLDRDGCQASGAWCVAVYGDTLTAKEIDEVVNRYLKRND